MSQRTNALADRLTVVGTTGSSIRGHQRELWQDCTVGIQGYSEVITYYSAYRASLPPGSPQEEQARGVLSARVIQPLRYRT